MRKVIYKRVKKEWRENNDTVTELAPWNDYLFHKG